LGRLLQRHAAPCSPDDWRSWTTLCVNDAMNNAVAGTAPCYFCISSCRRRRCCCCTFDSVDFNRRHPADARQQLWWITDPIRHAILGLRTTVYSPKYPRRKTGAALFCWNSTASIFRICRPFVVKIVIQQYTNLLQENNKYTIYQSNGDSALRHFVSTWWFPSNTSSEIKKYSTCTCVRNAPKIRRRFNCRRFWR